MNFHEVPKNFYPVNIVVMEWIVMVIVAIAMNNLFSLVASIPHFTLPVVMVVHVSWISLTLCVAVHVRNDGFQVGHFDMVIPT